MMVKFLIVTVLLLTILRSIVHANTHRTFQEPTVAVDPMKFVPPEFLESYKGFASDVVSNEIFAAHTETYGASAAYTYGIAYLLAVVNEKMFNIPNDGFDEALKIKQNGLTSAYKDMTDSLVEDSSVYSTSTIYTSNRTLEATDGVKALKTNVFFQDFSQPHVAVPSINTRVAIQTFGKIYDRLVPRGGWYGPSIYSFTKGVFLNTFYFKNKLLYPFVDIGKQFFMTDKVRMLGTQGNFRIRRAADFTTITLPMQDKRKSLVLVLPRENLKDIPFLEDALDSKRTDGFIETKPLTVEIPALNFTISNEYFSQLFYMGINNTMCNWNNRNPYFMQPVAQSLFFYLDSDKFEVAAATGSQLNNNREFIETTGITLQPQSPVAYETQQQNNARNDVLEEEIIEETTVLPNQQQQRADESSSVEVDVEERPTDYEEDNTSSSESGETSSGARKQYKFLNENNYETETIRFDKPFYWYLQDEVLGPVFIGAVNSFKTYRQQSAAVDELFDDMYKYQFWSCSHKHTALIDMFQQS